LLYVSNDGNGTVTVYSWPAGALVGTLYGFSYPSGMCVDRSGDVYIDDVGLNVIFKYRHGGLTPIKTLSDSYSKPFACSVDPTTGNLAVTDQTGVAIYTKASGNPKHYTNSTISYYEFPGYDDAGNLFVDAENDSLKPVYEELPKGGTTFSSLTLNQQLGSAQALQWDGKYLAIAGGGSPSAIFQFSISGSQGTLQGTTGLGGSGFIGQFWIPRFDKGQGTNVVAVDRYHVDAGIWNYPLGGNPIDTISQAMSSPFGVTVSKGGV
jgi:hypothetical protein